MGPRVIAAALSACLLFVAACGGGDKTGGGNTDSGGGGLKKIDTATLVTIITGDQPTRLDPHWVESGADSKILVQVYETLCSLKHDDINVIEPKLASSWKIAPDAKSIEFTVRPGVKFHDGADLDGRAVAMSLARVRQVEFEGKVWPVAASPYKDEFNFITGVKANGMTVTVTLSEPAAPVALRNLSMFAASIASPKLIESTKAMTEQEASSHLGKNPAGTGPYTAKDPVFGGAGLSVKANESYWGGAPAIKTLVFRQNADENARYDAFKGGQAEMVDAMPRQRWDELGDQMKIWWAVNVCYLGLNVVHEKTREIQVRRAIQLALDRDALLPLYNGTARPTYGMVAQTLGAYDGTIRPPGSDKPRAERLALAKKLLAEVGAVGRQIKLWFPKDERPYLPQPQKIADKIRQQLNETGLEVEIAMEENAKLFGGLKSDGYELVLIGWMSDNGDPDNFYNPLCGGDLASKRPTDLNAGRLFDEKLVADIALARSIDDLAKRNALYRSIETRIQTDFASHAGLVNTKQGIAVSKSLTGVQIDPLGHYRFTKATLTK